VTPPPSELPEERRAKTHRFLHDWVTGNGTLAPEDWAWEELAAFVQLAQIPFVNLLLSTYWSMGALRHGDYIAKVRVAPVQAFADRVVQRKLDVNSAQQVFRLSFSRLRTTPARKPRTECGCQPVAFVIAAMVAPVGNCSSAMTRDRLEAGSDL
jgi:hypothetical protein